MTPPARSQAAIELLDQVIAAAREGGAAADTLIARYFATRRYAGSKDRRAVRELVYAAIRRAGEVPASGRAALVALAEDDVALAASFDGSTHAPPPIVPDEPRATAGIAPTWLVAALADSGLEAAAIAALTGRAPLDLRVNALKATREQALAELPAASPTPHASFGLRLPAGTSVEALPLFRDGSLEVQDEGSQLVALAAGARPGMRVVDLCAGGGGKTLAMAADMAGEGTILACDIDRARLSRLAPRAVRAGATLVETRLLDPLREAQALADWRGAADLVMVDAPCSGTGTWRRNPEARWRLTPARLARLEATQRHLFDVAAPLVRPGGTLAYIVCSLLDAEGAGQVDAFLAARPGWRVRPASLLIGVLRGPGVRLDPATTGTDGFFVACLTAPC